MKNIDTPSINVLSYQPGMSGDFISYIIHQDKKYIDVTLGVEYMTDNDAKEKNRYLFPCLTENILGYEIKMHHDNITPSDAMLLKNHYKDKSIVLPTHKYRSPTTNIVRWHRLYTDDVIAINKAYVNWWLKSHIHTTYPGDDRLIYISKIEDDYWRNELTERYTKCKFMAYKYGLFIDSKFDIEFYINAWYEKYVSISKLRNIRGYNHIDINEILYNNQYKNIERAFEVTVDPDMMLEYVSKNENKFSEYGIDPTRNSFKQQLAEIAKNIKSIDLSDHISRVSR